MALPCREVNRLQPRLIRAPDPAMPVGMPRRLLIVLIALGLAPAVWLRETPPPPDNSQSVAATPLALRSQHQSGPLRLTGAWQLSSANSDFTGFSALVRPTAGQFTAFSDTGVRLDMPAPGTTGPVRIARLKFRKSGFKASRDVEAATFDPEDGTIWLALEGRNTFMRWPRGASAPERVAAPELAGWSENSGPEAMTRLADGRFIVLSEDGNPAHEGRLLPRAPDGTDRARRFRFIAPQGYRPTDMAELPDGRVLILLRELRWPMPPRFGTRLMLADPDQIGADGEWRGQVLAGLDGTGLEENYEGLAIEGLAENRIALWLISDDNGAATQRTLLLRLELDLSELPPRSRNKQKAPG